jgi:hypothetical protein
VSSGLGGEYTNEGDSKLSQTDQAEQYPQGGSQPGAACSRGGREDRLNDVGLRGGQGGPGKPSDTRRLVGEPAARRAGHQVRVDRAPFGRALLAV